MQPIGDYLKKLLYQYDCLVIPGLGAFLTHAVSASFHEETGQFLPPRRKLAFNEALMLDDGILLNYVMLHENCPREQALAHVQAFAMSLKQDVRQTGCFSVDGLGLFTYNAEEKLQFEPELRHNFLGSTYGMQPVRLVGRLLHLAQPVALVKPLPVRVGAASLTEPVADLATTALAVAPAGETEPIYVTLPGRRTGVAWRWAAAALLVGTLGTVSYFSVIHPGEPLQSSLNPASMLRLPASLSDRTVATALPTPVKPVVVMPAPVAPETNLVPVVPAKVLPAPPPVVKAAEVTEAPAVQPLLAPEKIKFTVIAGSFASRQNALRFRKRLIRSGYADAYIMTGKGLIKVAAIGTMSFSEAQAGIDSLNSLTGITPWILRN